MTYVRYHVQKTLVYDYVSYHLQKTVVCELRQASRREDKTVVYVRYHVQKTDSL